LHETYVFVTTGGFFFKEMLKQQGNPMMAEFTLDGSALNHVEPPLQNMCLKFKAVNSPIEQMMLVSLSL
jgi:hypothetical protein